MQSIAIGYGKVNFSKMSVTLSGFVVEAPFLRTLCSKKLKRDRGTSRIPCSANPDINGWLYSDVLQGPDGTLIMLQMSEKYHGSGIRDGALAIRLRKDGAVILVSAHLPDDTCSLLSSSNHIVFSGAGDILTAQELIDAGIEVNNNYVNSFMSPEEVEECFAITQVRGAISLPPKVEHLINAEGDTVTITTEKTVRRMRIRKT